MAVKSGSRRQHAKSHFGCAQCKERRIKCDEARPKCSRCSKRDSECTYAFIVFQDPSVPGSKRRQLSVTRESETSPPPELSSSPSRSSFPSVATITTKLAVHPSGSFNIVTLAFPPNQPVQVPFGVPQAPPLPSWLNLREQELYRHYLWFTRRKYIESKGNFEQVNVWEAALQKHASDHPFLFSGMLAISSFHLVLTQPDGGRRQQMLPEALQHQNNALSHYRMLLGDLNQNNLEPALAFSALISVTAFARQTAFLSTSTQPYDAIGGFLDIVAIYRGLSYLFRWGQDRGLGKQLSPMLQDRLMTEEQGSHPGEASVDEILHALRDNSEFAAQVNLDEMADHAYTSAAGGSGGDDGLGHANPLDPDRPVRAPSDMYLYVLERLKMQMRRMAANPGRTGYMLMWLSVVPNAFTAAIARRRPLALLVLAHWAAVLHDVRDVWWISDLGRRIVGATHLELPSAWLPFLRWPQEHVGLSQIELVPELPFA